MEKAYKKLGTINEKDFEKYKINSLLEGGLGALMKKIVKEKFDHEGKFEYYWSEDQEVYTVYVR